MVMMIDEAGMALDDPSGMVDHGRTGDYLHDLDDGAGELGGGALGVVLPLEDAVEELAALAELHDEVHAVVVLARLAQPHHPALAELRHAARDLHLPPHVVRVGPGPAQQQALPPDRLARQRLPRGGVLAPPRHAELAAAQLRAEPVPPREVRVDGARVAQDGGVLPALPALPPPLLCVAVPFQGAARAVAAFDGDDGSGAASSPWWGGNASLRRAGLGAWAGRP